MAITNPDRISKALEFLKTDLAPYVEREIGAVVKSGGISTDVILKYTNDPMLTNKPILEWDVSSLLKLMWDTWNDVFKRTLGFNERSLVSEIRDWRNKWAHQTPFSSDDTDRALDSIHRLMLAISGQQAEEVDRIKKELRRLVYEEQLRSQKRRMGGLLIETNSNQLKPWREIVMPHTDVASGQYQQAEFAADLWQVHLGQGSDEYRDPAEFFRRTFLTHSLQQLLISGMKRLSGVGGDPVVQLQTNFGGGKTHSMLALYHLFSGADATELSGVDEMLVSANLTQLPRAKIVVLVGNKISPGNPVTKPDGTIVCTLWGELAYQLGGTRAFARIARDDELGTSPGDVLRELFNEYGPCLILIDEWVAYARQLHDERILSGGNFETQFSFAQALTESAKLAQQCLLVVSLPASDGSGADDIEVGGNRGRDALDRLRNVVGRLDSSWRPATAEEGFEIVRRRLFQPLASDDAFTSRNLTARAFSDLYKNSVADFPAESRQGDYEKRILAAFPIHPEIFDRLYSDWSTLPKFQRTRGVLRLMAAVIHSLWEKGDRNPLILPSTIPMDDPRVRNELTRYLSDNWIPIIEKDVDGPQSLPLKLDNENSNLGKISATRRVARTVYLGSAPMTTAAHRGLEDRQVKLGCVMPGESAATFGDALRRLAATATYLYQDGTRVWYDTQPTVTKVAEDRSEELKSTPEKVALELDKRLRDNLKLSNEPLKTCPLPRSSADVPDDYETRLVLLGAEYPFSREPNNLAQIFAQQILESRGNTPRVNRNTLVFLAADKARLQDLDEALRKYLAWDSICSEKETLNLTPHQVKQAETQRKAAESSILARLPETYQWLLTPVQETPSAPITWEETKLTGAELLLPRAFKKLKSEEFLVPALGSNILRKHIDKIPLWRGDHVPIQQLIEDFARYPYLPRLNNPQVLIAAINTGLGLISWQSETFAYAESHSESQDEKQARYNGLRCGSIITINPADTGLLVKPDIAYRQQEAQIAAQTNETLSSSAPQFTRATVEPEARHTSTVQPVIPKSLKRFHGTVQLSPNRVGLDASKIGEEIITHFASLIGANVRITIEIEAEVPNGIPDSVIRIVTENSRTLKFQNHSFEDE